MPDVEKGAPTTEKKPDDEEEAPSKFIRLITVAGYVGSMSAAASTLAFYYLFLWDSTGAVRAYQKWKMENDK
jgi:hypothetical protein